MENYLKSIKKGMVVTCIVLMNFFLCLSVWAQDRLIIKNDAGDSVYKVQLDSAGNAKLGVGIPEPARQLHLKGNNAVFRMDRPTNTAAFLLVRTDADGNPLKTFVVGTNASGFDNGEFIINDLGSEVGGSGVRRMTITNNGEVHFPGAVMSQGSYVSSSIAHKNNVRTYDSALETVKRLRGVRFDWKESGEPAVGLIAEEVEDIIPEVVSHAKESGAATGVNYASLVGVLVEAVKEQQKEKENMQAELESLRTEMQQLKSLIRQNL